ncbi:MAG: GntR family transcriptional regulator [Christensenellales bacterium]
MINSGKKLLFEQIAEWVENEILADRIKEGDKIYSQNEFAVFFNVNPMTALHGIDLLRERGVVEKRRGIGMFVLQGAKQRILQYRKNQLLMEIIDDMIDESEKLGIDERQLIDTIGRRIKERNDTSNQS